MLKYRNGSMETEIQKQKYRNGSIEVRRKGTYQCLVPHGLQLTTVPCSQKVTISKQCERGTDNGTPVNTNTVV